MVKVLLYQFSFSLYLLLFFSQGHTILGVYYHDQVNTHVTPELTIRSRKRNGYGIAPVGMLGS